MRQPYHLNPPKPECPSPAGAFAVYLGFFGLISAVDLLCRIF
jgi:hypothetical protein